MLGRFDHITDVDAAADSRHVAARVSSDADRVSPRCRTRTKDEETVAAMARRSDIPS